MAGKRGKFEDLSGHRFGRLTVNNYVRKTQQNKAIYAVTCDCGNKREVYAQALRNGSTTSCGCFRQEAPTLRAQPVDTLERWWEEHNRVAADIAELKQQLDKKQDQLFLLMKTGQELLTEAAEKLANSNT
jgi:hypothetical protein